MKHIKTFESFLSESKLNESRISFKGTSVNDLYRIVKDAPESMVFSDGNYYSIIDPEEMRHDLKNEVTIGYDEDGGEHEIKISNIEFIELNDTKPKDMRKALHDPDYPEKTAAKHWSQAQNAARSKALHDPDYPEKTAAKWYRIAQNAGRPK